MRPIWQKHYEYVDPHPPKAKGSLYEQFRASAYKHRYRFAADFFGAGIRYDDMLKRVENYANVLTTLGLGKEDRVCICLPNIPDAAALFYAVSRIGGVSVMVHPLSSAEELTEFLRQSQAHALFIMDVAYHKHAQALQKTGLHNIVCCSMWQDAPFWKRGVIKNVVLRKAGLKKVPEVPLHLRKLAQHNDYKCPLKPVQSDETKDTAVILFSGGSSGMPKGICLSAHNFAALSAQVYAQIKDWPEEPKMMAILPFFHGFGLGVCMHAALIYGMTSIMVAQFNAKEFSDILRKKKPHIITGVPTLYEALLREQKMKGADLSFLKGVFVGGDACPPGLKQRFDDFLKQHGAQVRLKEGYGLTETVTACVVTPPNTEKVGAVGVPLPEVNVKVVDPDTLRVLPYGEVGELIVSSPTVMLGYLDKEETARVMMRDNHGVRWLRTGDLGMMDEDGFVWFSGRIKRIVKVSGFPVYPGKIEQTLEAMEGVARACCVAIPDDYKMNIIKAIVEPVTMPECPERFVSDLLRQCKEQLNTYARPRVVELMEHLPVTKVGKVDWKAMQDRENKRRKM